ncbi:response regulator [Candidatus Woesearchaeota archaeon]|nr:response regulator [Candidatus Woesearchaeota archaeon]
MHLIVGIDDTPTCRAVYSAIVNKLEKEGLAVTYKSYDGPGTAMAVLKGPLPSAIICDYHMLGLDGGTLVDILRRQEPRPLYIIASTDHRAEQYANTIGVPFVHKNQVTKTLPGLLQALLTQKEE